MCVCVLFLSLSGPSAAKKTSSRPTEKVTASDGRRFAKRTGPPAEATDPGDEDDEASPKASKKARRPPSPDSPLAKDDKKKDEDYEEKKSKGKGQNETRQSLNAL